MATNDPEDWPDIEGALRTYLRNDPGINAVVGTRVFFGIPRDSASSFPLIMITRIGGGQFPGDAPLDNPLIQFDVYARKAEEGGGRKECTTAALALRKALSTIRGRTRLDDTVVAFDPRVSVQVFSPLPGDDRPRCLVTATVPCIYSPE
jgi:hypothetical protein